MNPQGNLSLAIVLRVLCFFSSSSHTHRLSTLEGNVFQHENEQYSGAVRACQPNYSNLSFHMSHCKTDHYKELRIGMLGMRQLRNRERTQTKLEYHK